MATSQHIDRGDTATSAPRTGVMDERVTNPAAQRLIAAARIVLGFYFFWAFIDKTFGLGFSTPTERAWINGGSPTTGYLGNVTGPFEGVFAPLAGQVWVDWAFQLGLLAIGVALLLGVGVKIAAVATTAMVGLMYLAAFPLGQPADVTVTNPIISNYWLMALIAWISAATLGGDRWGLGRWWGGIVGNSVLR